MTQVAQYRFPSFHFRSMKKPVLSQAQTVLCISNPRNVSSQVGLTNEVDEMCYICLFTAYYTCTVHGAF